MNLDKLISKYLDGELNSAEDKQLRSLIVDDNDAKEEFESAIELNHFFKSEQENIDLPLDLESETEDLVMMKILSDAPERKRKVFAFFNSYASVAASFLLAFFIFMYSFDLDETSTQLPSTNQSPITSNDNFNSNKNTPINNQNSNSNNSLAINSITKSNETINSPKDIAIENTIANLNSTSKITKTITKTIEITKNPPINKNKELDIASNNEKNTQLSNQPLSYIQNELNQESNLIENTNYSYNQSSNQDNISTTQFENSSNIPSNYTSYTNEFSTNSNYELPSLSSHENSFNTEKLQLSTSTGFDLSQSGFNAKNKNSVVHFSQAISYEVSNKASVGIEFGYSEYLFDTQKSITIPYGSLSGDQLDNLGSYQTNNNGIISKIDIEQTHYLFWGTIFYDYNLNITNDISLTTRMGIGSSKEGPVGLGRLSASYQIYDLIELKMGLEGRMFKSNLSMIDIRNQSLRMSTSLIFGINFKL